MERFKVLFRNTAIRLSALYILLFALCAVFLVLYMTSTTERFLRQQTQESVSREVADMQQLFDSGGINAFLTALERRARQPGANLYVIAGPTGEILAGNVASIQPGVFDEEGWTGTSFEYEQFTDTDKSPKHNALAQVFVLPNGLRVLIGQDLGRPEVFRILVRQALMVALAVMGAGAVLIWFAIGRSALRRIDTMSVASQGIMAGDLARRLPVSGSGDEFDRMSVSLNAMLDRIEMLNEGLRQVSDNIAHDLKTPLTRIRNKAADALTAFQGTEDGAVALAGIINESEQLIRTFNALLMISRVEAGSSAAELQTVNLSAIAVDCLELCEPVAEDAGFRFQTDIAADCTVNGNRELLGQALFNLVDNAVKYAVEAQDRTITVILRKTGDSIVLSVADHGPGIPAERREDAVKRLVRLDESRSKPGTGLGLALVKAVMDLHKGRLLLSDTSPDAQENAGLTVTMVFPVKSS